MVGDDTSTWKSDVAVKQMDGVVWRKSIMGRERETERHMERRRQVDMQLKTKMISRWYRQRQHFVMACVGAEHRV